ncbi:MAG: arginine--tRNA ligase [Spirochaetaceae bacterium]|nr:MAG: arginine--tRNA ligase [Spirochaetaceae bacterium]
MINVKTTVQESVHMAIQQVAHGMNISDVDVSQIIASQTPSSDMGDIAFPMFPLAKSMRSNPQKIAESVAQEVLKLGNVWIAQAKAAGPYLNVWLQRRQCAELIATSLKDGADDFGKTARYKGNKVMVEFSCPNTNKPLHLGHLRNNSLGACVARLFAATGADVQRVNLINDRGVHICKSMLAYQRFGNDSTPESTGIKSDHFVGDYYVRFNQWVKEEPEADAQAAAMLQKWEEGDESVLQLWKTMNTWAIDGINQTYKETGIEFDRVYYESQTYLSGKKEVLEGLDRGIFYRSEDGAVLVDMEEIGLDTKVLLRKDGTSLYLTQDIGTAIARHNDWPFDRMVYVVGSEQQYHFRVLFYILGKLGFPWAENLYHLSYGMVNLPDGKMKSREGTVVDADDLLVQLREMAMQEMQERGRESDIDDLEAVANAIALGALNYFLLSVSPGKDMVFDPSASLSFNGNTGPYLQYVGARISSMMRKASFDPARIANADYSRLTQDSEWELISAVGRFPEVVEKSAIGYSPAELTNYLYDLGKDFSRYYHDTPVLQSEDAQLVEARLALCWFVLSVFKQGFALLGIPFLERM